MSDENIKEYTWCKYKTNKQKIGGKSHVFNLLKIADLKTKIKALSA